MTLQDAKLAITPSFYIIEKLLKLLQTTARTFSTTFN